MIRKNSDLDMNKLTGQGIKGLLKIKNFDIATGKKNKILESIDPNLQLEIRDSVKPLDPATIQKTRIQNVLTDLGRNTAISSKTMDMSQRYSFLHPIDKK